MFLFSGSWPIDLLMLFISICSVVYSFAKQKYSYWHRMGFKSHPDPNFLFGHFKPVFTQKECIGELMARIYKTTDEAFLGIYGIFRPIVMVRDLQAVRNILIKDFQHFTDRGMQCDEDFDPLSGQLFSLSGEKRKILRPKLSSTLTPGKVKVSCGS